MFRRLWLFILLALPITVPFWAQDEADIYRDVSPSVVSIEVEISRFDTAGGAGFVIDNNGHIVTNAHVVEDAVTLTVCFNGYKPHQVDGIIRASTSPSSKLMQRVIAQAGDFWRLGLPCRRRVRCGDRQSHGLDATLTRGIISGLNRSLEFARRHDDGRRDSNGRHAGRRQQRRSLTESGGIIGVNTAGCRVLPWLCHAGRM